MNGTMMTSVEVATPPSLPDEKRRSRWVGAVWLIARREAAENLYSVRAALATVIMLGLFILSAHVMTDDYRQRHRNWEANRTAQNDSIVRGTVVYELPGATFYFAEATAPSPPLQAPHPMSVVVKGLDPEVDRPAAAPQHIVFIPLSEDTLRSPFDAPDTSFMVKVLVSLFALTLSFGAITGEKESGTLRATLAQPVKRRTIFSGKLLGITAALMACLTVAFLGQFLYLRLGQGQLHAPQEIFRYFLLFCSSGLYGIVFVSLGLFISVLTVRTQRALVMALLAWVSIVLVLPNAAVLTAKLLSPAPTYHQLNARLFEAFQQLSRSALSDHPTITSIYELPNASELELKSIEDSRRITDEFLDAKIREVETAHLLLSLSPAGALASGQNSIAGTGPSSYTSFLGFLRGQRDRIIETRQRALSMPQREGGRLILQTMQEVSLQQRQPENLRSSLSAAVMPLLSLVFWAAALTWAALWRFERYDVR